MPTKPTNASIPDTGHARYFRYLARRCVERPELLLDGAAAAISPHMAYLDLARGTEKSTLVLGSQRSGSTLLAEIMATNARQRLVFEPLRGKAVGLSRNVTRGHYEDPTRDDPELHAILERVFDGRIRNLWVDRENTARFPRGRVIKDCLGTNLAPFVVARFPEVPVVYLLRHPIATAYSVTQLGWPDDLDLLLQNQDLLENQFTDQRGLISAVASRERNTVPAVVLRWCLENSLSVRTLPRGSVHFLFYETLVQQPVEELPRLHQFLRVKNPSMWRDWRPRASMLEKPSGTAWRDTATPPTAAQRLGGWQSGISPDALSLSLDILDAFGLQNLYGAEVNPRISAGAIRPASESRQ